MGIKNYLKFISLENNNFGLNNYDYVYVDCNYLIHYLIYKCNSDEDLYLKILNYWNYLSSNIKIVKKLFLFFDGNYDKTLLSNPKYQTLLIRKKSKPISDDYDKQSIFPGSKIIKIFEKFIKKIIKKYKKKNKLNFKIIINNDDICGEADIKILNEIYNSNQNNILICSKDSDMILISQSLTINKLIKITILSNLRPIKFININRFINYNLDYVLIVLFLGNDYLPKISNVNYNLLIKSYELYIKFNEKIILNNKINYNNLINYITYVIIKSNRKIKFKFENINYKKFKIYFNNINWCLSYYKVITNNNIYIQEIINTNKKINNTINIYNFINCLL